MPGITSYQFLDKDGNVISSKNPDILLMPASNMKIVTGFAAYKLLGEDYIFNTKFAHRGDSLLISGDPTFLLDGPKLLEIAGKIKESKVKIKEIVIDSSCIDSRAYHPSWMIGDRKYTYQAKVSPFAVNEGSIPGKYTGIESLVEPHSEKMKPAGNPSRHFAQSLWQALGLGGTANYSIGKRENGELVTTYSVPLSEVLKHIESVSCNYSIEVLTKLLSYKSDSKTGTWDRSIKVIQNLLNDFGVGPGDIQLKDGSGLSRLNLLSTGFLSNLIYNISISKYANFLELLPSPGYGTLKTRLGEFKDFRIKAKTGSIEYCSSLTGFVKELGISFSVILNHHVESGNELPGKVDQIVKGELERLIN